MTNQNGQLLLKALTTLNAPSSDTTIVSYVAESTGLDSEKVRETVMETLKQGVLFGYVQEKNKKYFVQPVILVARREIDSDNKRVEDSDSNTNNNGNAQPAMLELESDLDIYNNFEGLDDDGDSDIIELKSETVDRPRRKRKRSASTRGRRR